VADLRVRRGAACIRRHPETEIEVIEAERANDKSSGEQEQALNGVMDIPSHGGGRLGFILSAVCGMLSARTVDQQTEESLTDPLEGPEMEKYTLAEMLQRNISESAMSAADISQATGVEGATIRNFMRGSDIPLSAAQRLIDHFGNITITRSSF
jgi:hypothetical protein